VFEAPRVAGDAECRALGERPEPDLGRVGLADDHRAGRLQLRRDLSIGALRLELAGAAERGRLARQVHVVLDRERDAEQRQALSRGEAALRLDRFGPGRVRADDPEGVDRLL
jgi:hypothetical protein